MEIILNGKTRHLPMGSSLTELLHQLGFGGRPVLVEINQQALLASEHAATALQAGDRVEIIQIVAGG